MMKRVEFWFVLCGQHLDEGMASKTFSSCWFAFFRGPVPVQHHQRRANERLSLVSKPEMIELQWNTYKLFYFTSRSFVSLNEK